MRASSPDSSASATPGVSFVARVTSSRASRRSPRSRASQRPNPGSPSSPSADSVTTSLQERRVSPALLALRRAVAERRAALERCARAGDVAGAHLREAELEVRVRHLLAGARVGAELGDRLRRLPLLEQDPAQLAPTLAEVGREREAGAELGAPLVAAAHARSEERRV